MTVAVDLSGRGLPFEGEKLSVTGRKASRQEPVLVEEVGGALSGALTAVVSTLSPRDRRLARFLGSEGFERPFLIVRAVRREKIRPSRALALLTMETGSARNVWGHDPVESFGCYRKGGAVTEEAYRCYERKRGVGSSARNMQGCGPGQLTWWEFQERADRLGGCWRRYPNMRVAFAVFRSYVASGSSVWEAAKRYNGADAYADRFVAWVDEWQRRLRRAGF